MGVAQQILKKATGFVTRRARDRRFLFRPIAEVTAILWYAFAYAVIKHGMLPHAFIGMSNHLHDYLSDPNGKMCEFKADFHRLVAQNIKRLLGWEGTVFEDRDCKHAAVLGERGAIEKALYCVLNPVRAGLVATAKEWPGAIWLPGMRSYTAKKPTCWFTSAHWPDEITIHFVPPPAWTGSEDAWHETLARLTAEGEDELRKERIREGRGVLGAQRVKDQSHKKRPKTKDRRGKLNPMIATGGDGPLMKQAIKALRLWRRAYREALERWRVDKTTEFPEGSYWVVVHHGAAVVS
jgi:hypothetical protein